MFNFNPTLSKKSALLFAAGLTSACFALGAHAAGTDNRQYGSYVPPAAADKIVNLDAGTRYVNVNDGEKVEFVKGGQQFTWSFNTARGAGEMPLSAIAPDGFNSKKVEVYVASNPLYGN